MRPSRNQPQSGFVMMILIVIMVVGAVAYFGNFSENYRFKYQSKEVLEEIQTLNRIKQRLLHYAVFHPEMYQQNGSGNNLLVNQIPPPGYFPCPDMNADGILNGGETTCGNPRVPADDGTGFDYGFLPVGINARNIFFPDVQPGEYYYVVADRFLMGNTAYPNTINGTASNRYAPLNSVMSPASAPNGGQPTLADGTLPWLEVDGEANNPYVVLIIAPGAAQTFPNGFTQNRPANPDAKADVQHYLDRRFDRNDNFVDNGNAAGDRLFFSNADSNVTVNDIVVGITFQEWQQAIGKRIEVERDNHCNIDASQAFWFNDYDAATNPVGSHWRTTDTGIDGDAPCP